MTKNKTALTAEENNKTPLEEVYLDKIWTFFNESSGLEYLLSVDEQDKVIKLLNEHASLQTQEKDKKIAELKEARDEREELIKAFDAIRMEFEGRKWLMEGRGNYRYDDEKYKEEVRYIMDAFNEINGNLWRKIKSKTFEYRNAIESPLKSTIESQQKEIEELKAEIKMKTDYYEDKCEQLLRSYSTSESQLSEVTKERDELRDMKHNTFTPTKE